MGKKIKCYCVICGNYIGEYYPSVTRKICSIKCRGELNRKTQSGKNNPNYRHGKTIENRCIDCNCLIDYRATRCTKCRGIALPSPLKGKKHSKETLKKIGKKSKEKFTEKYINHIKQKHQGNKKRAINGYILIKDYNHPNKNSHNDILEHIKVMSEFLNRPIKKGEIIHHINMVRDDNRLENLYLYSSIASHVKAHGRLNKLVKKLINNKILKFENGEYLLVSPKVM